MKDIHPVSLSRHASKRCKAYSDHNFAASDNLVALSVTELPTAIHKIPVAFVPSGDDFLLVAVQGLLAGENLLVDTNGEWRGRYFPEYYHCYPFSIAKIEGSEESQRAVCIDEGSGLVVDAEGNESGSAPFFEDDESPSEMLKEVTERLSSYASKLVATAAVCKSLQEHGLLKEWEIGWREQDSPNEEASANDSGTEEDAGSLKRVSGLYCIDRDALASLSADALIQVRDSGALLAAYGQLYSMVHLRDLLALMQARNKTITASEISFDSIEDHGSISFEGI